MLFASKEKKTIYQSSSLGETEANQYKNGFWKSDQLGRGVAWGRWVPAPTADFMLWPGWCEERSRARRWQG